ncbi:Glutamate-1-semialdehyde 2,1-aminomutase,glutamate-1-semialdehyde aminotransferase,Glutamate-1-semialdehyde aminotransferase,glutamate-1-semialdehyde-2,1-aminomutase,Aminotransferase class-III [Chlamydia serpentis]|uniref:Glutamate-1-semialdehyde 2,1-aminomutase n=1 Tax=Chlamydia serpentis TaxID=1967782 RepID=A0A2R8FAB0_9CHLA|nr:glutamate-1-semialdehyde 2,1-aminomutase [Chlamydia serpentis]SPN73301.1 Glutamate-1-semialdehyde 2,1-aminomutase,glutamate-1-semialdehyde aminotransferase,Glutamate-1-semialdehyde aminotransferase,glutamate-1-semialdehyde-2,1-aminomutase,Aminotransferase class-III [Chlamydia serpentis]
MFNCSILQETPLTFKEACQVFPGGVNSPVRACRSVGVTPPIVSSAQGDVFLDNQGQEFIDFCIGWGALIHGHGHPKIVKAIQQGVLKGTSYGLTSEEEILFGKMLLSSLKLKEHKVRFISSGTEATMTAVRIARGITNRPIVIKFIGAYHGHADTLLESISINEQTIEKLPLLIEKSSASPLLLSLPYNNSDILTLVMESLGSQVAAIIFEPICANMGVVLPQPEFLHHIIELCKRFKSLSIMDEVVTGFRLGFDGAKTVFNVYPDIIVYGKILGGGMPVAALIAHHLILDQLMPEGSIFQAGTMSGNFLAMVAGRTAIELCQSEGFYSHLNALAKLFYSSIEEAIQSRGFPVSLVYQGPMFSLFFNESHPRNFDEAKTSNYQLFQKFYQEVFNNGIFLSPSPLEASFISSAHSEENLIYGQNIIIDSLIKIFDSSTKNI